MAIDTNPWTGLTLANGRYRITEKLGEGGMGTVYRACDQNLDTDVVVKVPRRAMLADPGFAGRFKDEIRSLVRLSHPHIVKLSDIGNWGGTPFAVMQYLPGGNLEDRKIAGPGGRFGAADPREVSQWLPSIAGALDYVHRQGYVHRDVKPANILFDAQSHPFLGDFGSRRFNCRARRFEASRSSTRRPTRRFRCGV
jgi:serine/threonine-protein kinase